MRISTLGQYLLPNLPYSLLYELYGYLKFTIRLPKRSIMKQWASAPATLNGRQYSKSNDKSDMNATITSQYAHTKTHMLNRASPIHLQRKLTHR